jgi:hypothetical protein
VWETIPIGEAKDGCNGAVYRKHRIIPDETYWNLNPYKRPPLEVWKQEQAGRRLEQDTSSDRLPLCTKYTPLPGKDIRELKLKHIGPVAILGNGESLKSHNLYNIPCPTIGMNRTYQGWAGYEGPNTDYYCLIDQTWLWKPEVRELPFVINCSLATEPIGYRLVKSVRMSPFSFDLWRDGVVPVNTGYVALQVAVYLGFSELYLFGFDFMRDDLTQKQYKGKDYPHFDGTPSGTGMFRQAYHFKQAAEKLKEHNLKAFFVGSPQNGSDAFPHITFEEFCERTA